MAFEMSGMSLTWLPHLDNLQILWAQYSEMMIIYRPHMQWQIMVARINLERVIDRICEIIIQKNIIINNAYFLLIVKEAPVLLVIHVVPAILDLVPFLNIQCRHIMDLSDDREVSANIGSQSFYRLNFHEVGKAFDEHDEDDCRDNHEAAFLISLPVAFHVV